MNPFSNTPRSGIVAVPFLLWSLLVVSAVSLSFWRCRGVDVTLNHLVLDILRPIFDVNVYPHDIVRSPQQRHVSPIGILVLCATLDGLS